MGGMYARQIVLRKKSGMALLRFKRARRMPSLCDCCREKPGRYAYQVVPVDGPLEDYPQSPGLLWFCGIQCYRKWGN